jgi:DNA-binding response OmpR family regulator
MAKRILMIDDENDITELMKTLLSFHDFEVDAFNDPQEVEKAVNENNYDLVMTDLMMPKMDGFAVVRMLRDKESYAKTPVIVLSAKTLDDEERKSLLHSDVHFLTKPFDPQSLVDMINELIEAAAA